MTLGVIFVGVWLALVFFYCLFKGCGWSVIDVLSCDCFSAPCCWGACSTIDRFDREYPFQPEYGRYPWPNPQSQMPPIMLVNKIKRSGRRDSDDASDYTSSSDDDSIRPKVPGRVNVIDPELREEAGGALLLRSSSVDRGTRANEPTVV